jgi:hypothetical protein
MVHPDVEGDDVGPLRLRDDDEGRTSGPGVSVRQPLLDEPRGDELTGQRADRAAVEPHRRGELGA